MRAPSSGASKTPGKRSGGRGPFLIRNLNSTMTAKVLGEMTYNPESCSWEGNDEAASIFDQPAPRARPALVSNFGGASRPQVVNGMVYDPKQRLWLGNEAEADPFKDIDALPTSEDAQSGHCALLFLLWHLTNFRCSERRNGVYGDAGNDGKLAAIRGAA